MKPLLTVLITLVAIAAAAALSGASGSGSSSAGQQAELDPAQLAVTTHGTTRRFAPLQFCADDATQAPPVPCGGARKRARGVLTHPRRQITLEFGARVDRLFVVWQRFDQTHRGLIPLTHPILLQPDDAERRRSFLLPRDSAPREANGAELLVIYDEPVRLRNGDGWTQPFTRASASYAIRLKNHAHP